MPTWARDGLCECAGGEVGGGWAPGHLGRSSELSGRRQVGPNKPSSLPVRGQLWPAPAALQLAAAGKPLGAGPTRPRGRESRCLTHDCPRAENPLFLKSRSPVCRPTAISAPGWASPLAGLTSLRTLYAQLGGSKHPRSSAASTIGPSVGPADRRRPVQAGGGQEAGRTHTFGAESSSSWPVGGLAPSLGSVHRSLRSTWSSQRSGEPPQRNLSTEHQPDSPHSQVGLGSVVQALTGRSASQSSGDITPTGPEGRWAMQAEPLGNVWLSPRCRSREGRKMELGKSLRSTHWQQLENY